MVIQYISDLSLEGGLTQEWGSVFKANHVGRLQVDEAFWGSEVRAQGHVWILKLLDDSLVELLPDAVELHDVQRIFFDPEFMEFVHQIAYEEWKHQRQRIGI